MDELQLITERELYQAAIEDSFFKRTPLQAHMREKCVVPFGGGSYMQNLFLYNPLIGGAVPLSGATFNTTRRETLKDTLFDPKLYVVSIVEEKAILQGINKGPRAYFSKMDIDLNNAMHTMSGITAIAMTAAGQGTRSLEINGLPEQLSDGVTPSYDGTVYTTYGTRARNGVIKKALNTIPLWCGNPDGSVARANYETFEEAYQDACVGNEEPDLGVGNKRVFTMIKASMQAQQRFSQEKDPNWGAMGFRFNNAMILKDDYFPSARYGLNDPDLGDYSTGTFVMPSGADSQGNFPLSGVTCTVGEVFAFLNTSKILLRISDDAELGGGFSGFIPSQDSMKVVGRVAMMLNMQNLAPRMHKVMFGLG